MKETTLLLRTLFLRLLVVFLLGSTVCWLERLITWQWLHLKVANSLTRSHTLHRRVPLACCSSWAYLGWDRGHVASTYIGLGLAGRQWTGQYLRAGGQHAQPCCPWSARWMLSVLRWSVCESAVHEHSLFWWLVVLEIAFGMHWLLACWKHCWMLDLVCHLDALLILQQQMVGYWSENRGSIIIWCEMTGYTGMFRGTVEE